MNITQFKSVLLYQRERFLQPRELVPREILKHREKIIQSKEIIVISGVRRSGKSTLLKLLAEAIISENIADKNDVLYINFEDPKLYNLNLENCQALYEIFLEAAGKGKKKYLFFDEIQNVSSWERWLNHLYEFEDVKMFVTGSNSSILNSDIATLLTGRNRKFELYPFSFSEFLKLKKCTVTDTILPENRAELRKLFDLFLTAGGFPEAAKHNDPEILKSYYEDIIYRDIIGRNQLTNQRELLELSKIIAATPGMIVSSTKLKNVLGLKSPVTVRNYLQLLTDAYLYYSCSLFDFSIKRQIYNPPKMYMVDHALSRAVSFQSTDDLGWLLENIVFLELRRRFTDVNYWKSTKGKEVDFIIREKSIPPKAFQITYTLTNESTKKRKISSLIEASKVLKIDDLNLITFNEESVEQVEGARIKIFPVWKWLGEGVGDR